jgi:alcohol dehydrogenase class IV
MLGAVLRFNLPNAVSLYAELGRAILPDCSSVSDEAGAVKFVDEMCRLVAEMPYAQTLREAKIAQADLPMLAADAMKVQRLLINNPRDVAFEDALALYQAAY